MSIPYTVTSAVGIMLFCVLPFTVLTTGYPTMIKWLALRLYKHACEIEKQNRRIGKEVEKEWGEMFNRVEGGTRE